MRKEWRRQVQWPVDEGSGAWPDQLKGARQRKNRPRRLVLAPPPSDVVRNRDGVHRASPTATTHEYIGFWLNAKQYFPGVRLDSADELVFHTFGVSVDPQ